MAASTSSSSSYSALLRRSKLASYNPQIDQVYTTTAPHLARQNFGLKRPLPAATTKTSPFVRISQLDSREGRTVFRKATRETSYVKRWQETGVGLQSEAFSLVKGRKWELPLVQSRFVPESLREALGSKGGTIKHPKEAQEAPIRTPNFLAMSESEFESYLDQLEGRREEFKQFVVEEQAKQSQTSPQPIEEFDLYAHAQSNPNELIRLVERFLRLPSSSSSSSSASSSSRALPQIHPTLALQYATPTPLESSLAAPIPGRLLGPSPLNNFNRPPGPLSSYKFGSGTELYSSVLSTVSPINAQNTSNLPSTTFFPDASSIRSNVPGRASFRLLNPVINPLGYANRIAIVESGLKKTPDFRPTTAEYEPSVLALRPVAMNPVVETPGGSGMKGPAGRHPIGSPAYSGALPPEFNSRAGPGGGNRRSGGGLTPQGLSAYFGGGGGGESSGISYKSLGVNERGPRDLLAGKKKKRTKEQQEAWLATKESLLSDRENENRRMGARGGRKGGAGNKEGKKEQLLAQLSSLLNK
ncbi:uncharacterized protein JCM6883_002865 [Sporobolomyces salmoneus]|uniref:uncharacterized protein n=1 Tax=Sporobolomyces salmoneus TaxID=183962 RepID=UPI0031780BDC